MASALEEREEQSSKCFICNIKVTTRSSYNIYCTFMPQREVLLMDVMSKILKKMFNPSQMRSSVLCRRQVFITFFLLVLVSPIKLYINYIQLLIVNSIN